MWEANIAILASDCIGVVKPDAVHVRLDILNILGQKVATVVNRKMDAGYHSVTWNAGNAASGVYLYRLTTGAETRIRKMLLLK